MSINSSFTARLNAVPTVTLSDQYKSIINQRAIGTISYEDAVAAITLLLAQETEPGTLGVLCDSWLNKANEHLTTVIPAEQPVIDKQQEEALRTENAAAVKAAKDAADIESELKRAADLQRAEEEQLREYNEDRIRRQRERSKSPEPVEDRPTVPLVFKLQKEIILALTWNQEERKEERIRQKIYYAKAGKYTEKLQYRFTEEMPVGISQAGALLILVGAGFPIQCYNTQLDLSPEGVVGKVLKDVKREARQFYNWGELDEALEAYVRVVGILSPFDKAGTLIFLTQCKTKYNEILRVCSNIKSRALPKIVIFIHEVMLLITRDTYEWGDIKAWHHVAEKIWPNALEIRTATPFKPDVHWITDGGDKHKFDSVIGEGITKYICPPEQSDEVATPAVRRNAQLPVTQARQYNGGGHGGQRNNDSYRYPPPPARTQYAPQHQYGGHQHYPAPIPIQYAPQPQYYAPQPQYQAPQPQYQAPQPQGQGTGARQGPPRPNTESADRAPCVIWNTTGTCPARLTGCLGGHWCYDAITGKGCGYNVMGARHSYLHCRYKGVAPTATHPKQ